VEGRREAAHRGVGEGRGAGGGAKLGVGGGEGSDGVIATASSALSPNEWRRCEVGAD
jgi:hypothetical protein